MARILLLLGVAFVTLHCSAALEDRVYRERALIAKSGGFETKLGGLDAYVVKPSKVRLIAPARALKATCAPGALSKRHLANAAAPRRWQARAHGAAVL